MTGRQRRRGGRNRKPVATTSGGAREAARAAEVGHVTHRAAPPAPATLLGGKLAPRQLGSAAVWRWRVSLEPVEAAAGLQMDFEFAAWQMLYLFTSPQRVYRNFHYRKQTKDQWARDDPAFLVLLSLWLCGFGFVLDMGFFETIKLLLWVVFIDCVGVGLLISTLMWFISNKYLVKRQSRDHDVEWGYAFDVHLNAFYPLLVILHFIQLFFINPLPFLKNTVILLYPFAPLILLYGLSLALGWNFTRTLCSFYKYRVK
ncbi:hypothetical protein J1605_005575 [Eschrichtius robustus]|uniref:Protein unc-50 n=1 Tax=Eschrichtius robustus TaxID=9764 RepID=A0AB34H908_ESCRO|nr:hypothetical protein J1605_005575 [Eschrichtius robustus]